MLNLINHKMPIYKECTLFELCVASVSWLVIGGATLSLLTWALFGYAIIGGLLSVFSLVHATRFLLGRLQRVKYGKPYGYYKHLFLKKLAEMGWMQSPWVLREGRWSVRRMKREF